MRRERQKKLPTWQELQQADRPGVGGETFKIKMEEAHFSKTISSKQVESYGMYFIDTAQYDGEPNIVLVDEPEIKEVRQYPVPTGEGIIAQIEKSHTPYTGLTPEEAKEYLEQVYYNSSALQATDSSIIHLDASKPSTRRRGKK